MKSAISRRFRMMCGVLSVTAAVLACLETQAPAKAAESPAAERSWNILTPERFAKSEWSNRLMGMFFKYDRTRLNSENGFIYWVSMNDCNAALQHKNEFDWDGIKTFYKSRADATLDALDTKIVVSFTVKFGLYDRDSKSFPLIYYTLHSMEISPAEHLGFGLLGNTQLANCLPKIPWYKVPKFSAEFTRQLPQSFAIDEGAAREFVASRRHPDDRGATIHMLVDMIGMRIISAPPKVRSPVEQAIFAGQVELATVVASFPGQPERVLGNLIPPRDPRSRELLEKAKKEHSITLITIPKPE
jgi:hypothetical protein